MGNITANTTESITVSTMVMSKVRIIAIAVVGASLIAGVIFTVLHIDREAPVITVEELELEYEEGTDTKALLQGVTAYDGRDGDVTASVIVDSIISLDDGKTAKVIYAAKDRQNNIGTAFRIVSYIPLPEPEPAEETEKTDSAADTVSGAVNTASGVSESDNSISENEALEEDTGLNIAAGAAAAVETEEQRAEENREEAEETPPDAADEQTAEQAQPDAADAQAHTAQTQPAAEHTGTGEGIPTIKLNTNYITMYQGDTFNSYAYIESATDDKDNAMTMVKIDGSVDSAKAGSYQLSYYVQDRDGNKSNVAHLQVVVLPKE